MTKILPKPKKWSKYPQNLKNDQNNPETQKITKIPLKPKKITNIPSKPKNDQNTPET